MSDDDPTVQADEATMDRLRQIAAEARASQAADVDDDMTVVGGSELSDEIRRIAEAARAAVEPHGASPSAELDVPIGDDEVRESATVVASGDAADEIRRIAAEARQRALETDESASDVDETVTADGQLDAIRRIAAEARSSIEAPTPPPVAQHVEPPTPSAVPPVVEPLAPVASPAEQPGTWQPPDRMVMPGEVPKHEQPNTLVWKAAVVLLSVALVVVLVYALLRGDGDAGEPLNDGEPVPEQTDGGGESSTEGGAEG